jgi:dihydroxyacetone kinase
VAARHALAVLRRRGLVVERAWSGNFLTALEMPGLSLSVMTVDDARLARLDAPTQAPAWAGGGVIAPRQLVPSDTLPEAPPPAMSLSASAAALRDIVHSVAASVAAAEARLTELDSHAGDGDLGASLARGAAALRALPDAAWAEPSAALSAMGDSLRRAIAGSSGPFYATALLRAARRLEKAPRHDAAAWADAFAAAVAAVAELGGAKPGDRTMLDALHPAAQAFSAALAAGQTGHVAWKYAVQAADQGATATAQMLPRLGRASYLGERALGAPDAGAAAAVVWMQAIAQALPAG